jgi:LAS superfamily LD-carboxypeptidase LdcB
MKSERLRIVVLLIIGIFVASCANEAQQNMLKKEEPLEQKEKAPAAIKIEIDHILGKFEPASHPDFVLVDEQYADIAGRYLHRETYNAYIKMYEAALKDSVHLVIVSATRNHNYQKGIWERKWTGASLVGGQDLSKSIPNGKERALKILEYSSMPGSSRHHWGTDLDLNNFENEWFEKGAGLKLFNWLEKNAATYGFCRPYTAKDNNRTSGYNEEKWHWSYMPLSRPYTQFAKENATDDMIHGFKGAEFAKEIEVIKKYVLGINKDCL